MNTSSRAPVYDLMKLIVAILLLLLFLVLLWRGNASSPAPTLTPLPPPQPSPTAALLMSPTSTPPPPPEPSPTATLLISPTATPPPPEPSPTATTTSIPIPTLTAESAPTITATAGIPPGGSLPESACELAVSRSRLQIGMNATIVRRLNFRSSPGIADNWLRTNLPGTNVEVVGGPVCLPHWTGAYVWWQIELPDGRVGWSAEASLRGAFYFMEPAP